MTLDPDGPVEITPGKFRPIPALTPEEARQARHLFKRKRELIAEHDALWTRLLKWHQQASPLTDTSTWHEIQDAIQPLKAHVKETGA